MLKQLLLVLSFLNATRCFAQDDSGEGGTLVYPIPVSPLWKESRHEAYNRIPVLPPQPADSPDDADSSPSQAEVLRMLRESEKSLEGFSPEELRSRLKHFNATLVSQSVTATRILPLVGPAKIRTCKYKCAVCLRELESERDGAPVRLKTFVLFVEYVHIHMVEESE